MNPVEPIIFAAVPRPLKEAVLLWRLRDALPGMTDKPLRLSFAHGAERSRHRYQVDFERIEDRLIMTLDRGRLGHDLPLYEMMWRRLPTFVRIFSRLAPTVTQVTTNISDGGGNQPNELAFCSDEPRAILVPDPAFMTPNIYEPFRELADSRPDRWNSREETLLWRGAVTGQGNITTDAMDIDDPSLKQRVRLCLALRGLVDVDARLVATGHDRGAHLTTEALKAHGILGDRLPPSHWIDVKFALDIDGSSNSWTNLYTRLLLGCCVLKVASPAGYRQWFYDEFVPWTHYVPVASDLSDVVEKIEWCRSHDEACREIAAAGQEFALRRTPESETVAAVQRINGILAGV